MIRSLFVLFFAAAPLAAQAPRPALIPWPAEYRPDTGRWMPGRSISYTTPRGTTPELRRFARLGQEILQEGFGVSARAPETGARADVVIRFGGDTSWAREEYRLVVSGRGVTIEARTGAGIFYGLQTLRQLAGSPGNGAGRGIPALEIRDRPRFSWRGLHLDVVRHFYDVDFVKRYIDLMAQYKYNTFHWHLTDDQGWRIEINAYPRLTTVGAWRRETIREKNFSPYIGDSIPYGGFYTQAEIREVVKYAAERYITIVPEIEMPGHAKAAAAAYPALACTPGPFEVGTIWGVEDDIFCPTDYTFTFLETVLGEVMTLFPSRYIHVGGDEVPKVRWRQSTFAQGLMRRENLRTEEQLQSYFIRRMERFLNTHGRRLVGWDEILEGGIAPAATVMSWRGTAGGIEAARQGHDVVMSPGTHVYFDHLQGPREGEPLSIGGYTPLEKTYAFEPVPSELSPVEARHILGAQANMWTEYVASPAHVEYMVYPRALALSEVLWSPAAARDWTSFTGRLPGILAGLDRERVNYRIPDVLGLESDQLLLGDTAVVTLTAAMNGRIRYTSDGTTPTAASTLYTAPIRLRLNTDGVTIAARMELPDGRLGAVRRAVWRKGVFLNPDRRNSDGLVNGLTYKFGAGRADSVAGVARLTVLRTTSVPDVRLMGDEAGDRWGVTLEGWIYAQADAIYQFSLSSDDGSGLWIGNTRVIDNDGYHGPEAKEGAVPLRTGWHKIRVVMFQGGGAQALSLGWRREGDPAYIPVPSSVLFQTPPRAP